MIIVLLVLLSISLLQVSHAVPYSVWRAAADYPKSQVGPDGPFGLANMCRETRKNDLVPSSGLDSTKCERYYPQWK